MHLHLPTFEKIKTVNYSENILFDIIINRLHIFYTITTELTIKFSILF